MSQNKNAKARARAAAEARENRTAQPSRAAGAAVFTRARCALPGGIEISYLQSNAREGVPLVLVHGFTGNADDFATVRAELAAHARLLLPELRGHGASTHSGRARDYTLEALGADLEGFLEMQARPAHLLGHSMAGMLALRIAAARPELCASLLLMSTTPEPLTGVDEKTLALAGIIARERGMGVLCDVIRARAGAAASTDRTGAGAAEATAADRTDARAEAAPADRMSAGAEASAAEARAAATLQRDAADRRVEREWGAARFWAWRRARLEAMDPQAYEALARAMLEQESQRARLEDIRCPTTVLVGELDAEFLEPGRLLAREIPGATLVVLPNAGHQPQHEAPAAWHAAVLAHLKRAAAR